MPRQHWERIHQYFGDWHAVLGSAQVGGVGNPIHRLNKIPPNYRHSVARPKNGAGSWRGKNEQSQGYASFALGFILPPGQKAAGLSPLKLWEIERLPVPSRKRLV